MTPTSLSRRLAAGLALASACLAAQAGDVAVSISVGQPGFYGRIDIGNQPAPRVVYREPIWVQRQPVAVAPVYLRVPPGHQRDWRKHCRRYDACGVPVYFVQEDWYAQTYGPGRAEREYREDREDREDRDERRRGNGHGRDHGNGKGHRD